MGASLGLAIILHLRRYVGINHDATVYLAQALYKLHPGIYGGDLFFRHGGSQDDYTLFPWMLARMLEWMGPATAFLWGELLSLLVFAAAGWYFLAALLPPAQRYWAWLAVLCLPTVYGKVAMFSYSEQFLTPRPLAEAFCLLGLGALVRGRWCLAAPLLLLAGAFHPLQAIAACLVAWPWLVMRDRRWLHLAWFALPVLALAVFGVAPAHRLLQPIDRDWLQVLQDNNPQLFLSRWDAIDFATLGLDAGILAYGWRMLDRAFARWCAAALCGLGLGLASSLVLVDGLNLLLPTQLQPWRVHWLAHWFAVAGLGAFLYRDMAARDLARGLVLVLGALMTWLLANPAGILLVLLHAQWPRLSTPAFRALRVWTGCLCGAAIAILFVDYVGNELVGFRVAHYRLDLYAFDRRILVFPFLSFGLAATAWWAWRTAGRTVRAGMTLVLGLVILIGTVRWDLRPPQVIAIEQSAFRGDLFGVPIPEHSQVLWGYDMPLGPWLALGRASYLSAHQLSGQVFNRAMAVDGRTRLNRLYPLISEFQACQDRSVPAEQRARCHISAPALRQACAPGANPPPDYLVLPFPSQPQASVGAWDMRDHETGELIERYRLFRCTDLY